MNKMKSFYCLSLSLLVLATACLKLHSNALTVRWHDGVALYSVVYSVNGQEVGRGEKAYQEVFRRIERVPEGGRINFEFPADIAAVILDRVKIEEPLPCEGHDVERDQVNQLCLRRKLLISWKVYKPETYLRKKMPW